MSIFQELEPRVFQPIGIIHTPYPDKFSVPRQPNLVPHARGILTLLVPYNHSDCVRGLEEFSHLWLIFQFHHIEQGKWHSLVRPPRLGGNKKVGVFASRSTHRPNPIGLSKVELLEVESSSKGVRLHLGSVDLVDGTPILDIKPYIAFADSESLAKSSFAQHRPEVKFLVEFSQLAQEQLRLWQKSYPTLEAIIVDSLAYDPRPAYQALNKNLSARVYGMRLYDLNIRWQIVAETKIQVLEISKFIPS